MNLAFEPVWPWPLLLLTAILLFGAVAVGYPRRIRHLPTFWRRLLIGLRITLATLLLFWLLRPALILETDSRSDAVLYLVLDTSGSMATPDGPGGATRHAEMLKLYEQSKDLIDDLGETLEVRIRELGTSLEAVEEPSSTADGKLTAIGANLEELSKAGSREKIAAILLWSDGKQAAMGRDNVDPLQAARILGRRHEPVYTVSFGTTDVRSNTMDVALSELDVPKVVFDGNIVPVKVRLRAFGAAGRDVNIRIYSEQRAGLPDGVSGEMQAIVPTSDNRTLKIHRPTTAAEDLTVELQFVPDQSGEIKIAVEAEPFGDEVRKTNNRVETIIRVKSGGIRVAYFDSIRPELKWLKRINVSNRVRLDVKPIVGGRHAADNDINDDWFEPGKYHAYIIGDVPADTFGEAQLGMLYACCEQGAGLMMIGGESSFGAGGYHKTPLARLLPIVMSESDQQLTGDVAMLPQRVAHSILQIAPPDQNVKRWAELPPLQGANSFKLKQGTVAQVLAESKNEMPLLVGQNIGSSRILAFAGDTTWQWALRDDWAVEAHQRFWRQVIFWLTKMENDGDSAAWITAEPRDLNPGGLAELVFGLRDEQGVPIPNAKYAVDVTGPDNKTSDVDIRAAATGGAGDFHETATSGDYWAKLTATDPNGLSNIAMTRFLVSQRDPELDNPSADPALMREIAHVSGGDYLDANGMIARLEEWVESGMPSLQLKRSQRITLWDNWISLLMFVLLLTVEWAVRKKRGLV